MLSHPSRSTSFRWLAWATADAAGLKEAEAMENGPRRASTAIISTTILKVVFVSALALAGLGGICCAHMRKEAEAWILSRRKAVWPLLAGAKDFL